MIRQWTLLWRGLRVSALVVVPVSSILFAASASGQGGTVSVGRCDPRSGPHADLVGCNLTGQNLSGLDLTYANLTRAIITNATVQGTELGSAVLNAVTSGGVQGSAAALPTNYALNGGYLIGPDVKLVKAALRGLDLSNADLAGANLTAADLSHANLTNTSFISGTLINTNLSYANLTDANLTAATVKKINVVGADSTGVIPEPVASDQAFVLGQEANMPPTEGLLSNDTGISLSVTSATKPPEGTLTVDRNGMFTFNASGYSGNESFGYGVSDVFGRTSTATVALNVTLDGSLVGRFADDSTDGETYGATLVAGNLWMTNYNPTGGASTVSEVDPTNGSLIATYPLQSGAMPRGIVFDGTNLWVVEAALNDVAEIDPSNGSILAIYPVGNTNGQGVDSNDIAFDGTNVWVTNTVDNSITEINTSTASVVGTYPAGTWPLGVTFDGYHIWIANGSGHTVTELNAFNGSLVGTYHVPGSPAGIAFDGSHIWIDSAHDTVTELNASNASLVATYPAGLNARGRSTGYIAFDGTHVWVITASSVNQVGYISELDASSGQLMGTYPVGEDPHAIAFDGAYAWIAATEGDSGFSAYEFNDS